MKKALFATFSAILILLFTLIFFSLYSRSVRHNEICNALELSMKQSMELLLLEEGGPASEEEWLELFFASISSQIESQSDLTIHIYGVDMDKGLLSAEAVLSYQNLIGTKSSVTTGRRTIILEEYVDAES